MNATLLKVERKTVRCTATEAGELFAAIPAKAQRSLPGHALATIIDAFEADGTADLAATLALLFPNEPPDKARRRLTTEIANRVYVDETGAAPLKIVQTRKGIEPALIWLERVDFADVRGLTEVGPRYAPDQFVPAEATQKTSAEIVGEIASPNEDRLPPPGGEGWGEGDRVAPELPDRVKSGNDALVRAARDQAIANLVKPSNAANDSLRGSNMSAEEFTATEATHAVGFSGFTESAHTEPKITVNALDAMLAWAADARATAPKLLALLGDYGTGKTSHALQFSRVLNGDVAHPNRPDATLSALHIDLAYLRGVTGLAHLNVTQIVAIVIEARGLNSVLSAEVVVREVRGGRRILVYDGLDELMQSDHAQLHSVFRQLLQVLEPDPVTREPSRARLIVSCRTHYFRDLTEQHEFFNTRLRHSVTRKDYLCLYLLPWKPATVRDYLSRRLIPTEAKALLGTITTTYNLEDLASRPVLLAMMCEQVGEVLRLREAGGGAVTASTLYAQTVAMWVRRDDEKHVLQATHKPMLMGSLACAMWNDGKEFWEADRLDRWMRKTVDALFPGHYSPEQTHAIQDDLRTATFIVRQRQEGFTFAHRSFMEFFLARHLVTLMDWEDLPEAVIRGEKLLPERKLSYESMHFLESTLLARQELLECRAKKLWSWLTYGSVNGSLDDSLEVPAPAPKCHLVLFQIACACMLDAADATRRANLRFLDLTGSIFDPTRVNIVNMAFPPLDIRGATLTGIAVRNCSSSSIWATAAQLDYAIFCDCTFADFTYARASDVGMIFRHGVERDPRDVALNGPWTLPTDSEHPSISAGRVFPAKTVYADDTAAVFLMANLVLYCWDVQQGTLRWIEILQLPSGVSDERLWVDLERRKIMHFQEATGLVDEFTLDMVGKRSTVAMPTLPMSVAMDPQTILPSSQYIEPYSGQHIQSCQIQTGRLAGCKRYFAFGETPSTACFDPEGRLVDYDEEAANTWLRYLGNGYPQPVEAAWLELDEMGRSLGPKKPCD